MSLVAIWVLADDGRWYEDPTIAPPDNSWYICFDDDDPIELVIRAAAWGGPGGKKKDLIARGNKILEEAGLKGRVTSSPAVHPFCV